MLESVYPILQNSLMLRSCAASRKISPEDIWRQQQQDVDEDSADEEAPHESDNIKRWIFPDGAQPYPSTDLSKEERSAIIVGPTASGKSELLRALHKIYSRDGIPESLVVGHGNTSTTATVTEYPLSVCCVSCKTVRNRDLKWEAGPPNESEVLKIFKGGRRDCRDYYLDAYMAKPVYGKHKFQVNFLDCPGDRDSKGRDEDHMADIAVRLARKGKLAAVIFVIGKAQNLCDSGRRLFTKKLSPRAQALKLSETLVRTFLHRFFSAAVHTRFLQVWLGQ